MDEEAQLRADLDAALRARSAADALPERIAAAEAEWRRLDAEVAAARRTAAAEREDVDRLSRLSPSRIRAQLFGSLDAELSREQAEAQAAEYALGVAEGRAREAASRLAGLRAQLADATAAVAPLAGLLRRREAWIARTDPGLTAELDRLTNERALADAERRQVEEAQAATAAASAALDAALDKLRAAGDWATWDMLGGGLFTDLMKYGRLDEADALIRAADQQLHRLAAELADVGIPSVGGLELDSLTSTLDVFFDNIFSDWSVRNRIGETTDRLVAVAGALPALAGQLQARADALRARAGTLELERERLLGPPRR